MKKKGKPSADPARPSAAQIARLAGISISRVNALRQQGRTDGEIVAAAQQRREQMVLRDFPTVPVNGHAADGAVSYAASLAEKEKWTAELRKIEVMRQRRELMPVVYFRYWATKFLAEAKDLWLRGPSELRDQLASETDPICCEALVRGFVEQVVGRLYQCERLWNPPEDGEPPSGPPPEAA